MCEHFLSACSYATLGVSGTLDLRWKPNISKHLSQQLIDIFQQILHQFSHQPEIEKNPTEISFSNISNIQNISNISNIPPNTLPVFLCLTCLGPCTLYTETSTNHGDDSQTIGNRTHLKTKNQTKNRIVIHSTDKIVSKEKNQIPIKKMHKEMDITNHGVWIVAMGKILYLWCHVCGIRIDGMLARDLEKVLGNQVGGWMELRGESELERREKEKGEEMDLRNVLKEEGVWDAAFESFVKDKKGGKRGLNNLGNTCYLNSTLQCLFHCSKFTHAILQSSNFLNGKYISNKCRTGVFYADLFRAALNFIKMILAKDDNPFSPTDLVQAGWSTFPFFRGFEQHDAQEYLSALLESLDEFLKFSKTKPSIISLLFGGKFASAVECLKCSNISVTVDTFSVLSLEIPTYYEVAALCKAQPKLAYHTSSYMGWASYFGLISHSVKLETCLSNFCKKELLDDQYRCEKCNIIVSAQKSFSFELIPDILVIALKRFAMFPYPHKLDSYVAFPMKLDFTPFLREERRHLVADYKCIGVVCHTGDLFDGHYFCYTKHGSKWLYCNDSYCAVVPESEVKNVYAYILFYEKENSDLESKFVMPELSNSALGYEREELFCLISYRWLQNFLLSSHPGPLNNDELVCPHGCRLRHATGLVVPINFYKQLVSRYGGGPLVPKTHIDCPLCLKALGKYDNAIKEDAEFCVKTKAEIKIDEAAKMNLNNPTEVKSPMVELPRLQKWKTRLSNGKINVGPTINVRL